MSMTLFTRLVMGANTIFQYLIAVAAFLGGIGPVDMAQDPVLSANALGFGTLSLLLLPVADRSQLQAPLFVFALLHTAVAAAQYLTNQLIPISIAHALFALAFWVVLLIRPS